MAKEHTRANMIVGLVAVAIMAVTVYFVLLGLWGGLASLDPRVGAAAVTVVLGGIIAGVFRIRTKRFEEQVALREKLREKKIPTLERLVDLIFDIQFAEKKGKKKPSQAEMVKRTVTVTQELVIWGSDDMLRAYDTFMAATRKPAEAKAYPLQMLYEVEDLLMAVRKDAGHENKNLERGSILRLFINDLPPS